jgi:hypothetical protein
MFVAVFILVVLAIAGALWWRSYSREAVAHGAAMDAAYQPSPKNQKSVAVRGWTRTELEKILFDFRKLYNLPPSSDWLVAEEPNTVLSVTFPNDVRPEQLFYLINYIRYPKGFDLKDRSIGVAGHAIIDGAFGAPDASLLGKRVLLYVPSNDQDYDFVNARIEGGKTYKVPFTTLIWTSADDATTPTSIGGL